MTTAWSDLPRWLDTAEKEAAALALITRLWNDKTEPYRSDLEMVLFEYLHGPDGPGSMSWEAECEEFGCHDTEEGS